jgi:acetoacetyl-CoA synthetase
LKVIDVAGGHSDMVFRPNADVVAAALDAALSGNRAAIDS